MPKISIIVPSARPKTVSATITALCRQYDTANYEILLVTPYSGEFFAQKQDTVLKKIRLISTERLYPPGKMRNIGARQAQGELLAFIDDDCVPPSEWLSSLEKRLHQDENIGAVGCRVVSGEQNLMNRCADHCLFSAYQYRQSACMDLGSAALLVLRLLKMREDSITICRLQRTGISACVYGNMAGSVFLQSMLKCCTIMDAEPCSLFSRERIFPGIVPG